MILWPLLLAESGFSVSGGRLVQSIWCGFTPALSVLGICMHVYGIFFFGLDFLNLSYVVCSGNMVVRAFSVISREKKSFSADDLCHTRYESPSCPLL